MSCLGEIGTTPAQLVRPSVGLIPTIELLSDRHKMDPSVSVPGDITANFAAVNIVDPLLEPLGVVDRTWVFYALLLKPNTSES